MRHAIACVAVVTSVSARAADTEEHYVASGGVSFTKFSELSAFGELDLIGGIFETRLYHPNGLYGLLHVRSEEGESPALGQPIEFDYLRATIEAGYRMDLWWDFIGSAGLNYTHSDLDVRLAIGNDPIDVAVSRENYGARARLERDLWGWAYGAVEADVSIVDEAVASVFEIETGPKLFDSNWALALRYHYSPLTAYGAVMLRYHGRSAPAPAPAPAPVPPPEPRYLPPTAESCGPVCAAQAEAAERTVRLAVNDALRKLTITDSFATGSMAIQPGALANLREVASILLLHPELTIEIAGHTDSTGGRDRNLYLSEGRANSVKDFLVREGVREEQLVVRGYGPDRPIDTNDTAEGRANNRRVEFRVVE